MFWLQEPPGPLGFKYISSIDLNKPVLSKCVDSVPDVTVTLPALIPGLGVLGARLF